MYVSVGAKTLETGEGRKTMPEDGMSLSRLFLRQLGDALLNCLQLGISPLKLALRYMMSDRERENQDKIHIAQRPVCLYRSDHLALVQSASLDTSRSYQNSSVKSMETESFGPISCPVPRLSLHTEGPQDYDTGGRNIRWEQERVMEWMCPESSREYLGVSGEVFHWIDIKKIYPFTIKF